MFTIFTAKIHQETPFDTVSGFKNERYDCKISKVCRRGHWWEGEAVKQMKVREYG
jgi:hypothetical protein